MDTSTTENDVVIESNESETETSPEEEKISIPRKEYDTLNQTLGSYKKQLKDLRKASKEEDETPEKVESKSSDLGEKAYLAVNGIKSADELAFVQKMKKETGRDVESLLETTYFQTEFKSFKEKSATDNAVPTGSKRSSNSAVDSVDYWIAKGELPPADQVQLRRDVVNARLKKESSKGVFYNS